tara:strand:+ start:83 stop:490 length:408 start_codon:yes stop_codon:yes gene_type:complete
MGALPEIYPRDFGGNGIERLSPTVTVGAESTNVIPVTFSSGHASAEAFIAEVYDANTEVNDAAFRLAETGDGAEVSTTAKARLIFTTSAAGAATISITDVAGGSGTTVYLSIRRIFTSNDRAVDAAPLYVAATFD